MPAATVTQSAFHGHFRTIRFIDEEDIHLTIAAFYEALDSILLEALASLITDDGAEWKLHPTLMTLMDNGQHAYFCLKPTPAQSVDIDVQRLEMEERQDLYQAKGSGSAMRNVVQLQWSLTKYYTIPFHVGHARGFKLPRELTLKHAVINVSNAPDEECFKYALLSVLHYGDIEDHHGRAAKYHQWLHELDFSGICFPFQARDLPAFERRNSTLAINLLEWKTNCSILVRGSPAIEGRHVVNILIVNDHYVGVVNLNRLLNDCKAHSKHIRKYCDRCIRPFFSDKKLEEHLPACLRNEQRHYVMPKSGQNILSFTKWAKTISPSHVLYGDIECMLLEDGSHKPIMCGFLVVPNGKVCSLSNAVPSYHTFIGIECIREMLGSLESTCRDLHRWNEEYCRERMRPLTPIQEFQFCLSANCYLCGVVFDEENKKKVTDHDHFTGQYLGAACNQCNLLRSLRRGTFPIVFHNLRGYDAHHIIKEGVGYFPEWRLSVIPTTKEGYLSIKCSFGNKQAQTHLQFIDSLQFLSASLASLVKNCPHLPLTSMLLGSMDIKKGKGVFPYNFLDSEEKLLVTELPPQTAFFDNLTQTHLSDDDYCLAQRAWLEFNCVTFGDYTKAYLRLDIHQLADVFEAFRTLALTQDKLDPVNYVSLPGLSWDSAFRMTGTRVELLTDTRMYEFFESGIRGGMTFVNSHRVRRSEDTELLYVDANNLYGQPLSMKLPQSHFKWIEREEVQRQLLEDLPTIDTLECDIGYVFEVDLSIPPELHNLLDDLPLAPETTTVQAPTPYMLELWSLAEGRRSYKAGRKLILSHLEKLNYVVHFAALQFYLRMGAQVMKIHRIVSFRQARFFNPYIAFNSQQRQQANNEFEKDFFKLKNNSMFGKTMENVRNHIDYRLCNTVEKFMAYTSKPLFLSATRFAEDLVGVELLKGTVNLDKPIFIGQAVLDLSKLVMYQLRYEKLPQYEKMFGGSIRVVAGDTDSFFLKVTGMSVTNQLLPAMLDDNLLDSSNYPSDHPLYSVANKAKLGCIKDECAGIPINDAIFLRPKCYSLFLEGGKEHKRAIGVQRFVLWKEITHSDYLDVVESAVPLHATVRGFRSAGHTISTVSSYKRSLSLFEDKRSWVSGDLSYAYGHKDIPTYEPSTKRLRFSIEYLIGV